MFDTTDQILDQLRAGEDGLAEFKALRLGDRGVVSRVVSPNTEDLAGELVAFANAAGGVVLLSVDDSGAAADIPPARLDVVERWIANIATHNCEPPIRPILRKVLLPASTGEERHVFLAEVPRGLYVHRTSGGRYYLRFGFTKRDLTPPELARLFQQRGREYVFDEQPVLAATVDHLNRHRLEAFFGRSPTIPWLDLLRNTRVTLRDEGGVDRPTVAGLLTFGTEPTEFLATASIEAACYTGDRLSSDDLVHAERLAGRAPDQIDAAVAFVAQFMQHPTHSRPAANSDPRYDSGRRRRGHCQCHRPSRLRHLRVEDPPIPVRRPARALQPRRPAQHHHPRRDALPHVHSQPAPRELPVPHPQQAHRAVFLESRGEGVRKILQDGEAHSGRRPEYELFGDELRLTVWAKDRPAD